MSKTEIRCNQCGKNWDGHESLMKWVIQGKQGGGLNNFCKEDCAEKFTNKMNKSQPPKSLRFKSTNKPDNSPCCNAGIFRKMSYHILGGIYGDQGFGYNYKCAKCEKEIDLKNVPSSVRAYE